MALIKKFIGGVILYDETIKQISNSNKAIPELISATGAVPGIKVDTGAKVMANSTEEKITEGLDGLRERLKEYYKLGARFTKWRENTEKSSQQGGGTYGSTYPTENDPTGSRG